VEKIPDPGSGSLGQGEVMGAAVEVMGMAHWRGPFP